MKYFKFTLKEKKIITTLMIINFFALFVNYFGLSINFKHNSDNYYICLFTNAKKQYSISIDEVYSGTNLKVYTTENWTPEFYPFVRFYGKWYDGFYFNGLFPYYDYTEFLVYSVFIFGFFITRNIFKEGQKDHELNFNNSGNISNNTVELDNLKNLFNLGILNETEYNSKVEKVKINNKSEKLKNTDEYKQLKSLHELGILTKEEFTIKINLLSKIKFEKKFEKNFRVINGFSEGLGVAINSDLNFGYVNENGEIIIDFIYEFAENFKDGVAVVTFKGTSKKINKENVDI